MDNPLKFNLDGLEKGSQSLSSPRKWGSITTQCSWIPANAGMTKTGVF